MKSAMSLAVFNIAVLAVAPVIPGAFCINHNHRQVRFEVNREDIKNADGNEEQPGNGSCKWNNPPDNGFNFRPCSLGLCWEKEGSSKRNGTLRFTRCEPRFVLTGGSESDSCFNGQWTSRGHKCIPCGRSRNSFDPSVLVNGEQVSSRGDLPWMAAVYYRPEDKWQRICGGTLLSPNLVLTATHCLVVRGLSLKVENLTVGLGKLRSSFYQQDDESSIISSVKEIVRQDRYWGVEHYFDLDIALLVLNTDVDTGPYIMPACVDWGATMEPKNDEVAYLGGWGTTEENTKIEVLKWEPQKYVNYNICLAMITPQNRKLVTHDKICAVRGNGTNKDVGDSGSGLTMLRDGAHYVYGVLSTRLFSDSPNVRLFTNVLNVGHLEWLQGEWQRLLFNRGSPRPTPEAGTEAGKDIIFRCSGLSLKPVELECSKENGELPQGRAHDDSFGVLLIKDVQTSDSGNYVCTVSDGFTYLTERALLHVGGLLGQ